MIEAYRRLHDGTAVNTAKLMHGTPEGESMNIDLYDQDVDNSDGQAACLKCGARPKTLHRYGFSICDDPKRTIHWCREPFCSWDCNHAYFFEAENRG